MYIRGPCAPRRPPSGKNQLYMLLPLSAVMTGSGVWTTVTSDGGRWKKREEGKVRSQPNITVECESDTRDRAVSEETLWLEIDNYNVSAMWRMWPDSSPI